MSNSQPKLYPCFACKKNGFDNVMVKLGGKEPNTLKTIYLEPDGTPHKHKFTPGSQSPGQVAQTQSQAPVGLSDLVKAISDGFQEINIRLDRLSKVYTDFAVDNAELANAMRRAMQIADKADQFLEQSRITDAKADRILGLIYSTRPYTPVTYDTKKEAARKEFEQELAEQEVEYDREKEDGTLNIE